MHKALGIHIPVESRDRLDEWIRFVTEWNDISGNSAAFGQFFDKKRAGLADECVPLIMHQLLVSSIKNNMPPPGTTLGNRFLSLKIGLETKGDDYKPSFGELLGEVQNLLNIAEQQGEGLKTSKKGKADPAVVAAAVSEMKKQMGNNVKFPPAAKPKFDKSGKSNNKRKLPGTCRFHPDLKHNESECNKLKGLIDSGKRAEIEAVVGTDEARRLLDSKRPKANAATTDTAAAGSSTVPPSSTAVDNGVLNNLLQASTDTTSSSLLIPLTGTTFNSRNSIDWCSQNRDGLMESVLEALKKSVCFVRGSRVLNKNSVKLIDSGASLYMSPTLENFDLDTFVSVSDEWVYLGDDSPIPIAGRGDILERLPNGTTRRINGCLHVPDLVETLVSITHLLRGTSDLVIFSANDVSLYLASSGQVLKIGRREGNLFYMDISHEPTSSVLQSHAANAEKRRPSKHVTYMDWHCRLGHVGQKILCDTLTAAGIPFDFSKDKTDCVMCKLIGFRNKSTEGKSSAAPHFLYQLSEDMFECPVTTYYKARYCSVIVDKATHYCWTLWLHAKSDFADAFVQFCKNIEAKYPYSSLVIIHGDGGELADQKVRDYCTSHRPHTVELRHSPANEQFLDPVERPLGIIRARAQLNLAIANLPQKFFNFAMDYAVEQSRILLHSSTTAGKSQNDLTSLKTPFEMVHGHAPDYSRYGWFGSLVAVGVPKEKRREVFAKLHSTGLLPHGSRVYKAEPGLFLGFTSSRIALIYVFRTQSVSPHFQYRFCGAIFPGLSLKPHHLNPYLSTQFHAPGIARGDNGTFEDDSDNNEMSMDTSEKTSAESPTKTSDIVDTEQDSVMYHGTLEYVPKATGKIEHFLVNLDVYENNLTTSLQNLRFRVSNLLRNKRRLRIRPWSLKWKSEVIDQFVLIASRELPHTIAKSDYFTQMTIRPPKTAMTTMILQAVSERNHPP